MRQFIVFTFSTCLFLLSTITLNADGCFFWWNSYERLREPNQKAIIVHDQGVEDLFLQVKYEGKADDFGWVVPLPSLPKVEKVTFSCFHMLDLERYRGRKLYLTPLSLYKLLLTGISWTMSTGGAPEVEVLKQAEISDYSVSVLKADNGAALNNWLKKNNFKLPENGQVVIDDYIRRKWYFVAIKIKAASRTKEKELLLHKGELPPLHFTFKTDQPVYPLYISSLNKGSTEVQIYLLAKELYMNKIFVSTRDEVTKLKAFKKKIFKLREEFEPIEDFIDEPIDFYQCSLLPALRNEISRPTDGSWFCSRFEKVFECKAITEDVIFSKNQELIADSIQKVRKHQLEAGFDFSDEIVKRILRKLSPYWDRIEYFKDYGIHCSSKKPKVDSIIAKFNNHIKKPFKIDLKKEKRRDKATFLTSLKAAIAEREQGSIDYIDKSESRYLAAAKRWLKTKQMTLGFYRFIKDSGYFFELLPKYKKLETTEKETAILNKIEIGCFPAPIYPQDRIILPMWLEYPRKMLFENGSFNCGMYHNGDSETTPFHRNFSFESDYSHTKEFIEKEEKRLNRKNSYWEEDNYYSTPPRNSFEAQQLKALELLVTYRDPISFDYLKHWLTHPCPQVKRTALSIMLNSLDNQLADSSTDYDLIPFVCESAFDQKEKNLEIVRPFLKSKDLECRLIAARIVALFGDQKSAELFRKIATTTTFKQKDQSVLFKDTNIDQNKSKQEWSKKFFEVAMIAIANSKSEENASVLVDLLKKYDKQDEFPFERRWLIFAASAYLDYPEIKNLLFEKVSPKELLNVREVVKDDYEKWLSEQIKNDPDPKLLLWREYYRTLDKIITKKEFYKFLKDIIKNPGLKLSDFKTFIEIYERRHGDILDEEYMEKLHGCPLIEFLKMHDNELFSDKTKILWACRFLLNDNLKENASKVQLSLLKTAIDSLEQELEKSDIDKKAEKREMLLKMLEKIVTSEINVQKNIKKHRDQFPEKHLDRVYCERLLKLMSRSGEGFILEEEEKVFSDFKKAAGKHKFDKNTIAFFTLHFRSLRSSFKDEINIFLKELHTDSALLSLLIHLVEDDEMILREIYQKGDSPAKDSEDKSFKQRYIKAFCESRFKIFDEIRNDIRKNPKCLYKAQGKFKYFKNDLELLRLVYKGLITEDWHGGDYNNLLIKVEKELAKHRSDKTKSSKDNDDSWDDDDE